MSEHAIARFVRKVKHERNACRAARHCSPQYYCNVTDDADARTGFIACGAFNAVYSYGPNKVIRISQSISADTSWDFLEWAQLEPQPWMPTVHQLGEVQVGDNVYKYAVLERLECITADDFYDADDALQEGKQHYMERFGYRPADLGPCNIMRRKTGEYVMNDPM